MWLNHNCAFIYNEQNYHAFSMRTTYTMHNTEILFTGAQVLANLTLYCNLVLSAYKSLPWLLITVP